LSKRRWKEHSRKENAEIRLTSFEYRVLFSENVAKVFRRPLREYWFISDTAERKKIAPRNSREHLMQENVKIKLTFSKRI
jgi:hypothetical protein